MEPTDAESEWHSETEEEDKLAVSVFLAAPLAFCVSAAAHRTPWAAVWA